MTSGFVEEKSFHMGESEVKMWRHKATGARLRLVQTEGPMVNMYVVVATEATNCGWALADDGLPHTLEHLVFLGSENYPFKGVLDKLANRCLARGTNAWTDVDHTAYTVTTAGSKGLLELLPIYLDHILRPTITDAGFATEVHHVDGEGENKGVVYCEMQGRENTAESVAERACLSELYPECGYSAETGGICSNVRDLAVAQVRRYHDEFYRAENTCLVVSGGVDPKQLLAVADKALCHSSLKKKKKKKKNKPAEEPSKPRPWISEVPPQKSDPADKKDAAGAFVRSCEVSFPCAEQHEEATGLVCLAWRSTKYGEWDAEAKEAALWLYLCDGAASPFAKKFVDGGDCSGVWPTSERFRVGYRQLWFEDVAVDRLEEIDSLFVDLMQELLVVGVDVGKMRDVLERTRRKTLAALEDDPVRVNPTIKHFVYAAHQDEPAELKKMSDALALLDVATDVPKEEWDALLKAVSLRRRVVVISRPSAERAAAERDDEEKRRLAICKEQGEDGLKKLASDLETNIAANEAPPPAEVLSQAVAKPDVKEALSKMFAVSSREQGFNNSAPAPRETTAVTSNQRMTTLGSTLASADWGATSARWCVDEIAGTEFGRVDVAADTRQLPPTLRAYLPLLGEALFKASVIDDMGESLDSDTAIASLRRDTVSYAAFVSGHHFALQAKVEAGNLQNGVELMRRAMFQAQVEECTRLEATVSKLRLRLGSELRDGASVASVALRCLSFDRENSNEVLLSALAQRAFLKKAKFALSRLGLVTGARWRFLGGLTDCRATLFAASNLRARIAGQLLPTSAEAPLTIQSRLLAALTAVPSKAAGVIAKTLLDASKLPRADKEAEKPAKHKRVFGRCAIVGVGSLEGGSAFLARCAAGPSSDSPLKEQAALAVAIEYLTALEGDFWIKIRGAGLAYGANMRMDTQNEMVLFSLYRSADPVGALSAARSIVSDYASKKTPIRELDFENARGSLASGYIESESTRSQALGASWRRTLKGHKADRHLRFLEAVASVTLEEAQKSIEEFILPLFDDAKSLTALAAAPAKLPDLEKNLTPNCPVETYTDATMDELLEDPKRCFTKKQHQKGIVALGVGLLAAGAFVIMRRR